VERVRAGLRNARSKGKTLGRAPPHRRCRQNHPPALTGAHCARDRRRARVQPQPCPQNPREWWVIRRCKRRPLRTP
jgi:DNA invertase Pin-like site-specific DNA recombinase